MLGLGLLRFYQA